MPLLDAHSADLEAASRDLQQRPQTPKPGAPRFSLWGTLSAAPRGTAAGAAEAIGSTADVLGAFGQALGSTGPSAGGMFSLPSEKERKESAAAADKIRRAGLDFMSEGGRSFRNVARDYLPDPTTTHAAEQAVGELFRVGGKALTAAAIAGPIPGAIASGVEEGFTASDKLAQQGVDLGTRSAVGLTTAAVQAVTFGMPVAGKTWGQTIGLALAGGPAGFVVQQAATREILAQADYSLIADQYDPFDPVGLTLSTVLPLGFGAIAMRAARAPHAPAPEVVDAARTALLAENVAASRPVPAEDLAGGAAHEQAYERAIDQLSAGQRVDVAGLAPAGERIAAELSPKLAELARLVEEQDARLGRGVEPPVDTLPAPDAQPSTVKPEQGSVKQEEGAPGAQALPIEDPALDARATALEQQQPDLMVQLEGMDAPAPLSEIMARLRQEVTDDLADAPLIRVAAECFLSNQ